MTGTSAPPAEQLAAALRSPFVPLVARRLEAAGAYLDVVWPQLAPSVDTAGFLGSALYMADMALDAVEDVYEPVLTPDSLTGSAITAAELAELSEVLDVFHWVQPQLLLLVAALAEAWEQPSVGGRGRLEPRVTAPREQDHLRTAVSLTPPSTPPLPEIAAALQLDEAPELYRAAARWPRYLAAAWEELQHLVAFPLFRQRGRGLYYYARSSSRFLAQPLHASETALRERGLSDAELVAARAAIDAALPTLATMMMHCTAMRLGLGINRREVVAQP